MHITEKCTGPQKQPFSASYCCNILLDLSRKIDPVQWYLCQDGPQSQKSIRTENNGRLKRKGRRTNMQLTENIQEYLQHKVRIKSVLEIDLWVSLLNRFFTSKVNMSDSMATARHNKLQQRTTAPNKLLKVHQITRKTDYQIQLHSTQWTAQICSQTLATAKNLRRQKLTFYENNRQQADKEPPNKMILRMSALFFITAHATTERTKYNGTGTNSKRTKTNPKKTCHNIFHSILGKSALPKVGREKRTRSVNYWKLKHREYFTITIKPIYFETLSCNWRQTHPYP